MSFTVEDGTIVADANSYATVTYVDAYHADMGRTDWAALSPTPKTVTTVDATDNELDITAHGYVNGAGPVRVTSSGTIPPGLLADTDYWVIVVNSGSIGLASSYDNALIGTKIDITGAGSGTIRVVSYAAKQQAIVRATRYIEQRWGLLFIGTPVESDQALAWPRSDAYDVYGNEIADDEIPEVLKRAVAEYALVSSRIGELLPRPAMGAQLESVTGTQTGDAGAVTLSRDKVGPIETERQYAGAGSMGTYWPRYPAADLLIGRLVRARGLRAQR